ncbi:hypothetical protein HYPSUDRAFT_65554 [Hypholoma sublateritium FD-334 SS-4]|uniref:Uncharacterized protein n=1 Tax=Hypholoma sublateritium (strain FD-334 SS-4) TaxID=945553 RepID=A0A0D2P7S4_HYPSF|nr:hypothetical protein HYPSUDRAFT_65554 [Hypholoma sublateritium FD-334 SS-4]
MVSLFPQPGPLLPGFPTLLITGPYHSSAPIHLALTLNSELGPQAHALILAPSRTLFKDAILRLNDHWLYANSGTGRNAALATSVTLLYPPTPVHLSLVLSMLCVPGTENQSAGLHPKTAQAVAPSLVVLAEPSRYFLPSVDPSMSSYVPPTALHLTLT